MGRIVAALALAAAPTAAHANAGIGYFMAALPFVLVALLPAILLEACVLAPLLPVPLRRAMALSFTANLQSSLWGAGMAVVVDLVLIGVSDSMGPEPTKATVTAMLVPLLIFTWPIEFRAIARRATEVPRRRIAAAAGVANLLSYAALIAFIWTTPVLPEHATTPAKMRVGGALAAAAEARSAVQQYYDQKGRLPQSGDEAGYRHSTARGSKHVSAIEIREQGAIVITLHRDDYLPQGGKITLTPTADAAANALRWKCRTELPPGLQPVGCRE